MSKVERLEREYNALLDRMNAEFMASGGKPATKKQIRAFNALERRLIASDKKARK